MYDFTFCYLLFTNSLIEVTNDKSFVQQRKNWLQISAICFLMLPVNFRFTEYSTQHEKTADIELWWGEETCIHLLVITFFHVS